ncbi:hypothetical protein [Bacillus thuringiensis]|uniref:hypothetical protein n=1 Tax=Bacillus thuringiensis TaxID=1428 RepID=UPI00119D4AD4|nr:hypothetical protein [Bacillus thuringiensis]
MEEMVVTIQFENNKFLGVFGETSAINQAITADSEDTMRMIMKNHHFEKNSTLFMCEKRIR